MNNILKPTIILALVAFGSALVLSQVEKITRPHISRQAKEKQERALSMVLPGYTVSYNDIKKAKVDGEEIRYWVGEYGEDVKEEESAEAAGTVPVEAGGEETAPKRKKGYAFVSVKYGYSGDVRSMVGVDECGTILGISIMGQTETPGLGARVTEKPSTQTIWGRLFGTGFTRQQVTTPWFQDQFRGLDLTKKIKIVKKGDWTPRMREELIEENAVSAITGATITTRTIIESIRKGIDSLIKAGVITIVPPKEEAAGEEAAEAASGEVTGEVIQ
ncbi:MAG: FMN-binding protein [bacterium]|nr:FMN-binding protein [bacterium]